MTDVVKMFTDILNPPPKKVSDNEALINEAIAELTARLNANATTARATVPPAPAPAANPTAIGGITLEMLLTSPVVASAVTVLGDNPDLLKMIIQAWMAKQQQASAPVTPATPPAATGGSSKP